MDEIKVGLQYAFQTRNRLTLAVSASGHGGMEASIGNLLERGESILIVKSGIWGERAEDIANRLGLQVNYQKIAGLKEKNYRNFSKLCSENSSDP